jgi:hypothetical protein
VFALRDIPRPAVPKAGPLRVEGYPTPVTAGISDPVDHFGFTRDGRNFVYCADVCCQDASRVCRLVDEAGLETSMASFEIDAPDAMPPRKRRTVAQLKLFEVEEHLVVVRPVPEYKALPPSPTGTFAYGGEMTIVVREIAGKDLDGAAKATAGKVQIGARLAGESPVFVVHPPLAEACRSLPSTCTLVQLNGIAASPTGDALGYVTFVALPSHGSAYSPGRIPADVFAGRVFNDTGMLHHQKKEWPRAAELFTRAVYADPSQELFAYNLACALAEQRDARAGHALRHALSLNRAAVKKRAAADPDFNAVRTAPWFEAALED